MPTPETPSGVPAALPLDELFKDQRFSDVLSGAVKTHVGRALSEDALGKALAPHFAKFAAPKVEEKTTPAADATKPIADPEVAKKIEELEAKVKRADAKMAQEKEERARERQATLDERGFNALRTELGSGARPEALDHFAKLVRAEGRLKVGTDGTPTIKVGEEELDLKAGVAALLKDPSYAIFLPAPSAAQKVRPGTRVVGRPVVTPEGRPAETPLAKATRMLKERKIGPFG